MIRLFCIATSCSLLLGCNRSSELSRLSEFRLPPAPSSLGRVTGTEFISQIEGLSAEQRELETEMQIMAGNFPDFLRHFVPVLIDSVDSKRHSHRILVFVMPDYIAVGSNPNFVRMPMRPSTAQRIADTLGLMLPTPKIVDEIYRSRQASIDPIWLRPSSAMTTVGYFLHHNHLIEEQLSSLRRGMLISGGKKDIVLTSKLLDYPDRVAIYGWHRADGSLIQRLNIEHASSYADYSHGVRFISRHAILDGKGVDLADVISDPVLHSTISNDGIVSLGVYNRRSSRIGFAH